MSGGDKILNSIKTDCDESIKAIEEKSAKRCEEIIAEGTKAAKKAADEAAAKAELQRQRTAASFKSSCELAKRNAMLNNRRKEIDKTFNAVSDYLLGLDDKNYFELLYKLAAKLSGKQGVLYLNKKDASRLPSDFAARLEQNGVKAEISNTTVDIDGGFILKCGDIEENMSITAILEASRDKIEDLINRELFV